MQLINYLAGQSSLFHYYKTFRNNVLQQSFILSITFNYVSNYVKKLNKNITSIDLTLSAILNYTIK